MADNTAYPGNPALPKEVRDKILSTFRHSLNLYRTGKSVDAAVGCEFILKMDPRFGPARQLMEKARNPAADVDVAALDRMVGEAPAPSGAESPDKLLISAIEAYAERDFDRAIENANRVIASLPGNNDAREILEKAKRKKDLQPHVENFRQRALFALESGQTDEAQLNFERMRSLDPEHPEVEKLAARLAGGPPPAPPPIPSLSLDSAFSLDSPEPPASADDPFAPPPPDAPGGMEGLDLGPLSESPPLSEWAPIPDAEPTQALDQSAFGQSSPAQAPQPNFADLWTSAEPASAALAPGPASSPSPEIERLLQEGDDLATRNPQAAIETWSRIFLIDLGNAEATSRIETARSRLAETNRRVAEAIKTGRSLYDGGQLKEAREKFLEVLAIDENEPTARSFLQRIEDDFSRPQGSFDLSLTSPAGDVLDDDDISPKETPPPPSAAERSVREAAPAKRRGSPIVLAAAGALVAAIGLGLYFVVRPSPSAPAPVETAKAPRKRPERPSAAADTSAAAPGTTTTPIPLPKAPPPGSDAKRAEAESALAQHRYITALAAFNLCAAAYPNDPGFRQEMGQAADRVGEISPAVKLYNDGDYETALPILWRLYQADHQNADVKSYLVRSYYDLGVINLQNNLFDKASHSFSDALGVDPDDVLTKRQKTFSDKYARKPPDLLARIYVKYLRPRP